MLCHLDFGCVYNIYFRIYYNCWVYNLSNGKSFHVIETSWFCSRFYWNKCSYKYMYYLIGIIIHGVEYLCYLCHEIKQKPQHNDGMIISC